MADMTIRYRHAAGMAPGLSKAFLLLAIPALAASSMARAQAVAGAATPIPEAEEASTQKLPMPSKRWGFIRGGYGSSGTRIFDGDSGKMRGMVDTSAKSDLAIDPSGKFYHVSESIWTKGSRGKRQDMVSIWDSQTLKLDGEIAIPGRLIVGGRRQNFVLSKDGSLGFVYNMQPSSSVEVVDLVRRKFVRTVELPGCATLFATPENGFSALCADGTLATVSAPATKPMVSHSPVFFSASKDPIFDNSVVNDATSEAVFLSYTGLVYQVKLGAQPVIAPAWSIQQAAGLRPGDTAPLDINWYPGGTQPIALHRPTGQIFVLMHPGEYWTHKAEGTEVWKIDLATRKVLKRAKLPGRIGNIEVTQDDKPLLIVNEDGGKAWFLDAATFEEKHKIERAGDGTITVFTPR